MGSSDAKYGRAIRPFQQARLLKALAGLQARAAHVGGVMSRLAEAEAYGPQQYRAELGETMDALVELSDAAGEVYEACSVAYDVADVDWQRAMDAMLRVLGAEAGSPPHQAAAA